MNDQAKTCNIVVDSSTNSINNTSCYSLDSILQLWLLRKNSLPNLKGESLCTMSQSIRIYKVYHSILNDWFWYSLTFLLIFDLCNNGTGSSCVRRSVHKRLKIIHLNFQKMELSTSVHYNSGPLFQRSNVVHVRSVQLQKVHCFIASAY